MLSVELINTYDDFLGLEPVWGKMVEYCEFPTIFQLHSWCKVWWKIYGKDKELYILIIKRNSIPIGLAPLMLSGHSKKRSVEFIGTGNADYTDFMIDPRFKKETLECIFNFLLQNKEYWAKVSLIQMSERTGSIELLKGVLSKINYLFRLKEVEQCHVFEYFDDNEGREKFESGLNKHRNLRNSVNFFKKNGSFCYKSNDDIEIISKKLPKLFFFHWRRWEKTFTPSKFLNYRDRKFYYEISKELCKSKNISLEELSINNKSIAYVYSFLYKKTIFLYTASFNVFFNKKSPSTILYYYIIDNYIKNRYVSVDFMRGEEKYKEKLTNKSYSNYEIVIFKNVLKYYVEELLWKLKESSVLKKVSSNQSIKKIKQSSQAAISNYGLIRAVKLASQTISRSFFDFRKICIYEFDNAGLTVQYSDVFLEFVELKKEDANLVSTFYGAEMSSGRSKMLEDRFLKGNRCFALKYNNIFVMMCFVDIYPFTHFTDEKNINLKKNHAVLYDICCIPEF